MGPLLKLAWRNIWRNRRRSLITMSAVLFSVLIITLTRSLQYGSYDAMESSAVRMLVGELQIQRTGYKEEETFAESLVSEETEWEDALASAPWLEESARRLTGFGLVSSDAASAGAMILGIEPDREPRVTTFGNRITGGAALEESGRGRVLLGETLARNLSVGVSDSVVVLTQGYRNEMGAEIYQVHGLLKTGSLELDRALMVVGLKDAQQLFAMDGRFTQVVLRTDDFRNAPDYARELRAVLPADRYAVFDWDTLMPELRQIIVLDNAGGAIFLLFMLVLVGFEVFNTTTMSVVERSREFGVLQAIGMRPRGIATVVLAELFIKILLALAVSIGASALLLLYLKGNPIPLTAEMVEMYEEFGYSIEELVFSTRWAVFAEPLFSVAAIAVLATIYPVMRVFRLEPVEALRYAT